MFLIKAFNHSYSPFEDILIKRCYFIKQIDKILTRICTFFFINLRELLTLDVTTAETIQPYWLTRCWRFAFKKASTIYALQRYTSGARETPVCATRFSTISSSYSRKNRPGTATSTSRRPNFPIPSYHPIMNNYKNIFNNP